MSEELDYLTGKITYITDRMNECIESNTDLEDKLKEINDLMEKADLCDCNWEPACQECLEAWIEAKRLSS